MKKQIILLTILFFTLCTQGTPWPFPNSGQAESTTNTFGEDLDYNINPHSNTKLDENGNELLDSSTTWAMVRDNETCLIWEVKTNDGSIIHDKENEYSRTQKGKETFTIQVTDNDNRTETQNFELGIVDPIVITTNWLNDGIVGQKYEQTLSATGGLGEYQWEIYTGILPDGLTLKNGKISGTPNQSTYGAIVFTAKDMDNQICFKDFTFHIADPLEIMLSSFPNALKNEYYSEAAPIKGGIPPFSFDITELPPGLKLNAQTGIISGTPTGVGYYNVVITVSDNTYPTPQTVSKKMGLRTSSFLAILTSAVIPPVKQGMDINSIILYAAGGPSPYQWQIVDGDLPVGITLDPETGLLSGNPINCGYIVMTLQVEDVNNRTAQKEFLWHIYDTLTISTTVLPDAAEDIAYQFAMKAKGGVPPYSWRFKSGELPSGLSLNSSKGILQGTPTSRSTRIFTIEVNDNDTPAQLSEKTFTMEVLTNDLYIFTTGFPNCRVNTTYSTTIKAALGKPPYTWSIESGQVPPGLKFNSTSDTATLEGTPTTPGTYEFTLKVKDSDSPNKEVSKTYTIFISSVNGTFKIVGEVYDSSNYLAVFQKNNTYYLITGSSFGIKIHKRMGNTFKFYQNLGSLEGKFYDSVNIFYQNNAPYFSFIGRADTDIYTWNENESALSHIQNIHLAQYAFDYFIIEDTPWLALAYEDRVKVLEWNGTQFTEKATLLCPEVNPKAIYVNNTLYLVATMYEASTLIYKWNNIRFMPSPDFQVSSVNKTLASSFSYNDEQFFLFYTSKWPKERGETFEIDRWNGDNMELIYEGTTKSEDFNSFSVDKKQFVALNDNPKEAFIESIYEWKDNKLELYQAIPDAYSMNYFSTYFTMDGKTYLLMTRPAFSSTLYEWESNEQKVNKPPKFVKGHDLIILEDSGENIVEGWATDIDPGAPDEIDQELHFIVETLNQGLFAKLPGISANGTLTFQTAANLFGESNVKVYLRDNGGATNGGDDESDPQEFIISVISVNDSPEFLLQENEHRSNEDAIAQQVINWTSDMKAGPSNENSQDLTFKVTTTRPEMFQIQPEISRAGVLTYHSAPNVNGEAIITVQLQDDGGTENGGKDTSNNKHFKIIIQPINDPPIITDIPDQAIEENHFFSDIYLDDFVTDVDDPDNRITWTIFGSNELSVKIVDHIAKVTVPYANWLGSETLTFKAEDQNGLYANDTAIFTVTKENSLIPPNHLSALQTPNGIQLKWIPIDDTKVSYTIYRSQNEQGLFYPIHSEPVNYFDAIVNGFWDTGIEPDQTYFYKIKSYLAGQESLNFSNTVHVKTADDHPTFDVQFLSNKHQIVPAGSKVIYSMVLNKTDAFQGVLDIWCENLPAYVRYELSVNHQPSGTRANNIHLLPATLTLSIITGSATLIGDHQFDLQCLNSDSVTGYQQKTWKLDLTVVPLTGGIFVDVEPYHIHKNDPVAVSGRIYLFKENQSIQLEAWNNDQKYAATLVTTQAGGWFEDHEWLQGFAPGIYTIKAIWEDTLPFSDETRSLIIGKTRPQLFLSSQENQVAEIDKDFTIKVEVQPAYAYETIKLRLFKPEDSQPDTFDLSTDENGQVQLSRIFFQEKGKHTFKAYFMGNDSSIGCESNAYPVMVGNTGFAILVGGGIATNQNLEWNVTKKLLTDAYLDFKRMGFSDDMIYLMIDSEIMDINGDDIKDDIVDEDDPSVNKLIDVIKTEFSDVLTENDTLYLFMMGHGTNNAKFRVYGTDEYISSAELNTALNDLQETTSCSVVIILEYCYSGTFIQALHHPKRLIITSADNEPYRTDDSGNISLSRYLFSRICRGYSIQKAFEYARIKLTNIGYPSPRLDDYANDHLLADSTYLPEQLKWTQPEISHIDLYPILDGKNILSVSVSVESAAESITKVWAQVIPPVVNISSGTGTIQFHETQLSHVQGTEYSGNVEGFSYDGNYTVIFYAKNRSNEVSEPVQWIVRAINIGRKKDFNQDGFINLEDMIIVLRSLSGMNVSEGIDLADAVHLMQYLGK